MLVLVVCGAARILVVLRLGVGCSGFDVWCVVDLHRVVAFAMILVWAFSLLLLLLFGFWFVVAFSCLIALF